MTNEIDREKAEKIADWVFSREVEINGMSQACLEERILAALADARAEAWDKAIEIAISLGAVDVAQTLSVAKAKDRGK